MLRLDRSAALLVLISGACIIAADDEEGTESVSATANATDMGAATGSPSPSSTEGSTSNVTDASTSPSAGVTESGSAASESGNTTGSGPSANERCLPLCEALTEPACEGGLTLEGCMLTCEVLTSANECDPTAHLYFDCIDASTVTCDAAGDPQAPGCGPSYVAAILCAVTENPNPAIVEPCQTHCELVGELECPNNASEDDCNTNCLWLGATGTGCDDEWAGYIDCFAESERSCLLGFAVGSGCGPAFDAYTTCINE